VIASAKQSRLSYSFETTFWLVLLLSPVGVLACALGVGGAFVFYGALFFLLFC
jgi:hypothetical protein